ncbi:MAG: zinc-ribbon domain-containing protein, partial [Polyangiaceae bacterium]
MDVTCERCSTEYEFDDALVSERGTTVKCTNCGHQFKVRRNDGVTAPERWLVRTVDGRELEFTALRELQGAIAHARITRDDVLSRSGSRPRRLGSIAELEPFFSGAIVPSSPPNASWPVRSRVPTPTGLGGPTTAAYRNEGSVAIPLPIAPG